MGGIETKAHAAEVVQLQARWDWPGEEFVGETMGFNEASIEMKDAISMTIRRSSPEPTRPKVWAIDRDGAVFVHLAPEALFDA